MNIVQGILSWLHRNPVQVATLAGILLGILQAADTVDLTVEQFAAGVAVAMGLPAAIRSKVGTASTGGWFKS